MMLNMKRSLDRNFWKWPWLLAAFVFLLVVPDPARAGNVLVEAESFTDRGGWVVDQQSMDTMGSPYLLAHGLRTPVADAVTTVTLPEPGEYRVFVRTKDWVARWKAPGAPGKFQVLVDGRPLMEVFGTRGVDWSWHDGGTVSITKTHATLALHDLTGFEGRCDAIVLSSEPHFVPPEDATALAAFRREALGLSDKPHEAGRFDLVVVGGGVAGCCTAISAARLGLSVALIQDRPVLGGNASSEIRVGISGRIRLPPYPVLGEIVEQMNASGKRRPPNAGPAEAFHDDVKLRLVNAEKNLSLFLCEHVFKVEAEGNHIIAVVSKNLTSACESRYAGRWFADCTGDGTVGFLAGADYDVTEKGHLGSSNLWAVEDTGKPVAFPRIAWGLDLEGKPYPKDVHDRTGRGMGFGEWCWESGFDRDTIREAETIRDHNLRAMYSVWSRVKNVDGLYPNHQLVWAAYISGKRESRRLLGDVVLTKKDILSGNEFPDRCVTLGWAIDLHYPDPKYAAASPGNEFLSDVQFTHYKEPYAIPYRCLYSKNIDNLMMAGRNISVTHEALGPVRVQGTTGMMGEVLSRAAFLCKRHNCNPRDVYQRHLDEFKKLLLTSTMPYTLKQSPGINP